MDYVNLCLPIGKFMFNQTQLTPMKKAIILVAASLIALVAVSQEFTASIKPLAAEAKAAVFNWTATSYDFGKIKKDVEVEHVFTFTNAGESPLIISSVKASCGCTVAEYSTEAIAPGEKGFVKAKYNAAKSGVFTKTVTINSNTEEGAVVLTIKGEVVE